MYVYNVIGRPAWLPADKFDSCNIICYHPFILLESFYVLSVLILYEKILLFVYRQRM